ncbi:hypothetical protein EPA93_16310 [Ktedonosporobacter rubrisoli]|uniref:Uncharacterized protein n=1 Tax=Ktedonosporobacter rubrisoli TaxID=2509675 RepID=A0A4P6JPZ0_KTERU|nr:hypothetical protein [Ktedonosporobacter rubrisoli]QBD77467.1 hypothetical protein EPA93_16310 [Ktedonosporobacter rubrisoli]
MESLNIEGAKLATGKCFVEYNLPSTIDVAAILRRHAREEFEPGMLLETWGGRVASYWPESDHVLVVETCTFTAPGWSGPLTHVEMITQEQYQHHVDQIARGQFAPMNEATKG